MNHLVQRSILSFQGMIRFSRGNKREWTLRQGWARIEDCLDDGFRLILVRARAGPHARMVELAHVAGMMVMVGRVVLV
jgi:hypothetical protein